MKNIKTAKSKCFKNENLRCFKRALQSILNPAKSHTDGALNYNITKYEELNMEYPVKLVPANIKIVKIL